MPYTIELEPEEMLVTDIDFQPSEKSPLFGFAVSDRAFYIPATKFVVSGDPHYFKRVPATDVTEVKVEPIRPYGAYVVALLMAGLGAVFLWSLLVPGAPLSPRVLGLGLALLVGSLLLPFVARGRHRLLIRFANRKFRWTPPLVVDSGSRRKVNEVLDDIVAASDLCGVRTDDRRKQANGPAGAENERAMGITESSR
jgi:hypothetical protein